MASPLTRPCSKCHEIKRASEFSLSNLIPFIDGSGWKYGICKVCASRSGRKNAPRKHRQGEHPVDTLKKVCSKCKEIKGLSKFYPSCIGVLKNKSRWKATACKACMKDADLLRKYNITLDDKSKMLEDQGSACEICQVSFPNFESAYVDHNHTTGEVRDLLCHNCNVAIGHLKENCDVVLGAIVYLVKHNGHSTHASKNTIAVELFLELPFGLLA